jgi:two-component system sensor histidine kinase TctE
MTTPVRSLLQRLLRRVIVPLALTWLIGTLLAFAVARFFTQQAFDRALLDDAYAVASHVRQTETGGLTLGLTANEMGTLLFDQSERLYFAVFSNDDRFLAGHAGLQMPQLDDLKNFTFTEMEFNNKTLRAVVLMRQVPQAFKVVVAQTTYSQVAFFQRLLVLSMVPQLLLLLGLAWWLRRKIQQDVQPLTDLQNAVALRDVRDLKPVFVSNRSAEMQNLSEAINALLLRIEKGVRSQKEFAGNVAHELRTPLAGMKALTDYALSQSDPAVWREQLEKMAASQERASHLMNQLLAIALVQEAQESMAEPVKLDEVIRGSIMRHLHRADALGIDLGASGLEENAAVWVMAQRALIEGVIDNLIDNAFRYGLTPAGTQRRVTVGLSSGPSQGQCQVWVHDNGPGIPPLQREHLLQRWVQGADGPALQHGSGLGLAIVSDYARIMNAQLFLETADEGRGLKAGLLFQTS